jgi:cytochrome c oxidase assembly factor CtaG
MPLKKVTTDIAEVATVNASVLGVTTFADFETILKIILIIVSIGYTIARWRTHCNKKK